MAQGMQALARNAQALLQLSVDGRYCFVNLTTAFCERSSGSSSPSASSCERRGRACETSCRCQEARMVRPYIYTGMLIVAYLVRGVEKDARED